LANEKRLNPVYELMRFALKEINVAVNRFIKYFD
jgi:hypothetical protein